MNLRQAEKIIWSIQQALESGTPGPLTGKLAEEYLRLTQAVSQRLEQCAEMTSSGSELQALLAAEAAPALPDLVSLVSFKHSTKWRELCQKHGLAVAPRLPERALGLLNALYAKQITPNHDLYKQFRSAMTFRNSTQALETLRLILKLNPEDKNAREQAAQIEEIVLKEQGEFLLAAIKERDEDKILDLAAKIESLGLLSRVYAPLLPEVARLRAGGALARGEEAMQKGDWLLARTEVDLIARTQEEHPFQFIESEQERLQLLLGAVSRHEEAFESERAFGLALGQLEQSLVRGRQLIEERSRDRQEYSRAAADLDRSWRQVNQFSRPVPDGLDPQTAKTLRALRAGQAGVQRGRRNSLIAVAAVLILAALCATHFVFEGRARASFAEKLRNAHEQRSVEAAKRTLSEVENRFGARELPEALRTNVASAREFVRKEEQLLAEFAQAVEALAAASQDRFGRATAEDYARKFQDAETHLKELAPEFVLNAENNLAPALRSWLEHRVRVREKRNAAFESQIIAAEKEAVASLTKRAADVKPTALLNDIETLAAETNTVPGLEVRADLLARYDSLSHRVRQFESDRTRWDSARTTLTAPESAEKLAQALNIVTESPFASREMAAAARTTLALGVSPDALLGALLLPGNPAAWKAFRTNQTFSLFPEQPLSAEIGQLEEILKDPHLDNVMRWSYAPREGGRQPEQPHTIYVKGAFKTVKFGRQSGDVLDPVLTPTHVRFVPAQFDPPNDCILEVIGPTEERLLCERAGLSRLLHSGRSYSGGIIPALDVIVADQETSSTFRAWLVVRLYRMMALQPNGWGAQWCPSVTAAYTDVVANGADEIQSGDWLVSDRNKQYSARLDPCFSRIAQGRFAQEARFLYELSERAVKQSFELRGMVQLDGSLKLLSETQGALMFWALSRQPAVSESIRTEKPALPLSPIFSWGVARHEAIAGAAAAARVNAAEFKKVMPPFYQDL